MSGIDGNRCKSCGSLNEVDNQYCGACGARINPASSKLDKSSTILRKSETSTKTYVLNEPTILDIYQTIPIPPEPEILEEDHWINLRWFILISEVLAIILIPIDIIVHVQVVTASIIVLALVSLILAFIQSFYFNQWYWLTGILVFSPLVCIAYTFYNPINYGIPQSQDKNGPKIRVNSAIQRAR